MAPTNRKKSKKEETGDIQPEVAMSPTSPIRMLRSATKAQKMVDEALSIINHTKPQHFEFGGPIGAAGVVFVLPIVVFGLYFLCNDQLCLNNPLTFNFAEVSSMITGFFTKYLTNEAFIMYVGWMLFQVLLERILPGEEVEGVPLENKSRLSYVMSGHLQFWISIVVMGHIVPSIVENEPGSGVYSILGFHALPLHLIYDHYPQLIFISTVAAYILSIYLYVRSFLPNAILAKGGNTGYAMYDFFIGRELNPRIGSLDLKEFCELRPGLIGWLVINLGMAVKQYMKRKAVYGFGSISPSMLLITLFQGFYVWDALYMEKALLTTMDITTDGFGFMLAYGDLVWVPFIYSLQARYLVDYDPNMNIYQIAAISALHMTGYYIFRSANSEKDAFRRDPSCSQVSHLRYLQTKRGTKLLTSGWWGAARKINYTGDWLITVSWCLLCGFQSPIPYFQAVYFLILLVHRAMRDDEMCLEKYGDDWIEYKKQVPYLFIPFVW